MHGVIQIHRYFGLLIADCIDVCAHGAGILVVQCRVLFI